jgi:hypothetical protein
MGDVSSNFRLSLLISMKVRSEHGIVVRSWEPLSRLSWNTNTRSVNQEIPRVSWNPKFLHHVHKGTLLVPIHPDILFNSCFPFTNTLCALTLLLCMLHAELCGLQAYTMTADINEHFLHINFSRYDMQVVWVWYGSSKYRPAHTVFRVSLLWVWSRGHTKETGNRNATAISENRYQPKLNKCHWME